MKGVGILKLHSCLALGLLLASSSACTVRFNNVQAPVVSADLEQRIEMIDYGLDSATTTYLPRSTLTNFNTAWFDGTVTYTFEIVARNTDGVNRTVELWARNIETVKNTCAGATGSGSLVSGGSITIPAGTTSFTRLSTTFTAVAGNMSYFVSMPATNSTSDVQLAAARIGIRQVGATKTHIYVPMTSYAEGTFTAVPTTPFVDGTASLTFAQGSALPYYRWKKEISKYATIATSEGFVLDTVISSSSGAQTASSELYNVTTGTDVAATAITYSGGAILPQLCNQSFETTDTNFTDNQEFEVRIKSSGAIARLFKAGLWISLTSPSKFVTFHRLGKAQMGFNNSTTDVLNRIVVNTSAYSVPTYYQECVAAVTAAGMSIWVLDTGANDVGTAGSSTVALSEIAFTVTTKTRLRSSAFNLTDGNRYANSSVQSGVGSIDLTACVLLIQSN